MSGGLPSGLKSDREPMAKRLLGGASAGVAPILGWDGMRGQMGGASVGRGAAAKGQAHNVQRPRPRGITSPPAAIMAAPAATPVKIRRNHGLDD